MEFETLESWVMNRVEDWREHYETNYQSIHQEYYRLWRGIWESQDKSRDSERSRIISPALQQAVESSVAEIEEATFGRGRWFDIEDDDGESEDIAFLREKLFEDFKKTKVRKAVGECLINAAVFGTGIGEIVLEEIAEMAPAMQPIMGGDLQAVGVTIQDRVTCRLRPVLPQNFLIDPNANCIEDALGVAIDEFVPRHSVEKLQEKGIYKDVPLIDADFDFDLEADRQIYSENKDRVRITKYYGLVPSELMEDGEDGMYTEAVIVICNGNTILKEERNPYMMGDRPVIAFPWDVVPGRFWGRGVCEKGYNSQKALDTELRARIDALALTIHPMMGIDSTRMPRGNRPEIKPGKIILTNGRPSEIMEPITFGRVDQITFAQAGELQKMVQTATGAIDSAGIPGSINGEATAAGISMSLGAIIKRHKRTLINFQESFIIPFVTKCAHRYMQFDPEHYPVSDYNFITSSSLGIIAREYEVTQLTQLLQTMQQDSPLYPMLVESIIENMNLSNREEMVKAIKATTQQTPEQQQAAQAAQQAAADLQAAQTAALQGQAAESQARAEKYLMEKNAIPAELEIDKIRASLTSGDIDEKEFERRLKIADLRLREREIAIKERNGNYTATV